MTSILRDAHNYAKKNDLYLSILFVLLLIGIVIFVIFSDITDMKQEKKQSYKLNWERIMDNNIYGLTIYRARIYGGWLVQTTEGSIAFIPLNHPDGWVLEK